MALALIAACVTATARSDESAEFPLKFTLTKTPAFTGVVGEMDASGNGLAIVPSGIAWRSYQTNLSEGYYLALAAESLAEFGTKDASLARTEVVEVLKDNKARFRIAPSAAAVITKGRRISFLRPNGSSTAELKLVPDLMSISEPNDPNAGSMWPPDQLKMTLSSSNIREIALALHNYHSAQRRFPPWAFHDKNGKPTVSWRVLILPFLGERGLFAQFKLDEPWDSDHNKPLLERMPAVYRDRIYGDPKSSYTNYAGVAGPHTVFPADDPDAEGHRDPGASQGVGELQIIDGSSKTLFVGTVSPDAKIPWTKPEDIVCDEKLPPIGKPGSFAAPYKVGAKSAALFAFVDGHVQSIRSDISMSEFHKLVTRDGQEPIDDTKIPVLETGNRPTEATITITNVAGKAKAEMGIHFLTERGAVAR